MHLLSERKFVHSLDLSKLHRSSMFPDRTVEIASLKMVCENSILSIFGLILNFKAVREGHDFNRPVWKRARSMQLAEIKRMNERSFEQGVHTFFHFAI